MKIVVQCVPDLRALVSPGNPDDDALHRGLLADNRGRHGGKGRQRDHRGEAERRNAADHDGFQPQDGQQREQWRLGCPALDAEPGNYILLWKLADNITEWARIESENATKDESESRYMEAVGFARQAVEVEAGDAEGWYQLGKALGRLALFRGGKEKVNMSKEIKEVFEHAIQLDSQHADALHGLARWHREVANLGFVLKAAAKIVFGGLPPASNEESVALFLRAIAIDPQNCAHHLELGKTYLEMREKEMAAEEFETVLSLPVSDPDDPEWKAEAEELLGKIRR